MESRDEDLPILRPLMGGGGRRPQLRSQGGSLRNAVLAHLRRGRSGFRARTRVPGLRLSAHARRVIVKAHVHRMHAGGAKAAALHLRYIERDGVERDGSKGVLYTASGVARAEAFEQPRSGEKHQFRIVVSPEDGARLDLTLYVRRLMATVEQDMGRKLEWAAVNHYDTEHPHAHILIRGVDRDAQEVRLARAYISNGLRVRAQELATEELGPRNEFEIRRARASEVSHDRFTSLDRELERSARENVVAIGALERGAVEPCTLIARLKHLEELRLAEPVSPTAWRLAEGWQKPLRDLGARGDILKQIHAAISGDPCRYHVVGRGQELPSDPAGSGPVVSGRVASKGLSDELKGDVYAIVETPTGRAYHLTLDARTAETVRAGDIVSFTTKPDAPVRPVDRHIAAVARAGGGLCRVERTEGAEPPPHERRLRELERLGLAVREAPGRWKISPTLLQDLAERQRGAPPRHRLLVHREARSLDAQVRHPGPVWLDRIKTDSLAPYGFGGELRQWARRRREALRGLGVNPDDPNRSARLRELEREGVGRRIAARSGQTFLARAPDSFRGRVQLSEPDAEGGPYATISDGRRFVLLRATVALRASSGRTVTVTRDAKGRLVVRPGPDRDIGL